MSKQAILIYCIIFLLAPQCFAERLATLSKDSFNEHFSSVVPVSGNVLVGAVYSSTSTNNKFFLDTTNGISDFCFKVSSINGTYISENDYKLIESTPDKSNRVYIEYPTKFEKIITAFNINQLAPLATTGSCDDQRYQHVLLSSRAVNVDDSQVLFMISSGRSEVFMQLKSATGKQIKAKCERLEEGKRTSYDTICEVPASTMSEDTYNIKIARRKNGRSLPATTFTLQKSINETHD